MFTIASSRHIASVPRARIIVLCLLGCTRTHTHAHTHIHTHKRGRVKGSFLKRQYVMHGMTDEQEFRKTTFCCRLTGSRCAEHEKIVNTFFYCFELVVNEYLAQRT